MRAASQGSDQGPKSSRELPECLRCHLQPWGLAVEVRPGWGQAHRGYMSLSFSLRNKWLIVKLIDSF